MTRYFMAHGDVPMTESSANGEYDNAEEALKDVENFKKEILCGEYDEEWGIEEEEEREAIADDVFAYAIEYTKSGSITKSYKL